MMSEKKQLDEEEFMVENELVIIKMKGSKQVISFKLKEMANDKEMVEDMTLLAINQVLKKVEEETNKRMGKYTQGMPGMF